MVVSLILSLLLLVLTLLMIREENNAHLIMQFFLFSFAAACLYTLHSAPDLALAEIAIGCAFIPLVFIITIMRQNTFTVAFFSSEETQSYCDPEVLIRFMAILETFCDQQGLKPKLITHPIRFRPDMVGIFRPGNIDVLADYDEGSGVLRLMANGRNLMIPQLQALMAEEVRIRFQEAEVHSYED